MIRAKIALLVTATALAAALAYGLACADSTVASGVCSNNSDCYHGYVCVLSRCAKLCNTPGECPRASMDCVDGLCREVTSATCDDDSDCTTPGACQIDVGATCWAGACQYAPKAAGLECDDGSLCSTGDTCDGAGSCVGSSVVCDQPPANICNEADDAYYSHPSIGTCDPATGICSYEPTEVDCANCSTACLGTCSGVVCEDTRGGCATNGTCTPAVPPACQYSWAVDGTACTLPAGGAGVCAGGSCVECLQASDCVPDSHAECFTVACSQRICVYTPLPDVVCEQPACMDGFVWSERLCGDDGSCPIATPPGSTCNGYACNATSDGCLASCQSDADCAGALSCLPDETCEAPKGPGESCSADGECASGFCVDSVCCNTICNAICQRCDATGGTAGQCHAAAAGSDPDNNCTSTALNCILDTCSGTGPSCAVKSAGSDCGTCAACDAAGRCLDDLSQDTDCGLCQECASGGRCVNQPDSADEKEECGADPGCGSGTCNGFGACDAAAAGSQPAACNACRQCDGSGNCANVPSGQSRQGCDAAATICSAADTCDGSGACSANHLDSGAQPAGCDVCQECNGSGGCVNVQSGQTRPGCDATATPCSGADTCDGTGGCDTNDLSPGAQPPGCDVCQECNSSGGCANVASGQTRPGCDAGATTCSRSDICNGSGGCDRRHRSAGYQTSGCEVCRECNGSGSCRDVASGQARPGCDAGGTACSQSDICNGSGGCDRRHRSDGYQTSGCEVCRECNGSGSCRDVASGQTRPGCNAGATTCSGADSCNGSGACDFAHLSSGAQPAGCNVCNQCNGSGGCGNSPAGRPCDDGVCPGFCDGSGRCEAMMWECSCDPNCRSCQSRNCEMCCSGCGGVCEPGPGP